MWYEPISQIKGKPRFNQIDARDEVVESLLLSMLPYAVDSWYYSPTENVFYNQISEEFSEKTIATLTYNENGSSDGLTTVSSEGDNIETEVDSFEKKESLRALGRVVFMSGSILPQSPSTISENISDEHIISSNLSVSINNESGANQKNEYDFYVIFRNGNSYFGRFSGTNFDGYGTYRWADGSSYEGEFRNNTIIGNGKITWPDLSWYRGQFFHGFRHGIGTFYLAFSPTFYHGEWCWGQRHGKGFLLYSENVFYDGEWRNNCRKGTGEFSYSSGCYYSGQWLNDERNGFGTMCWSNNDCYKGHWLKGEMHDYGQYIWDAVVNFNFCFPIENVYCGMWKEGARDGFGTLEFGFVNCARYEGSFKSNLKHGDGTIICGNGLIIHHTPLFLYDKPIHLLRDGFYTRSYYKVSELSSHKVSEFECKRVPNTKKDLLYLQCARTIDIPIHVPMYQIDFTYHIKKAHEQLFPYSTHWDTLQLNLEQYQCECFEKTIKQNLPTLWKLYGYYSTICAISNAAGKRPCIMVRLCLWQMYRDCHITKRISLIKTDKLLAACDNILLETVHNPFQKIYFWQFLHSLLCVAWHLYSFSFSVTEEEIPQCIIFMFDKLLDRDIIPHLFQTNGFVLLKYLDLAPLTAMYKFYRSIGEPLPIRQFLARILSETVKYTTEPDSSKEVSFANYNGRNTVNFGSNIEYKSDESIIIDLDKPLTTGKSYRPQCSGRIFFEMLKSIALDDLIKIMMYVCPLIEDRSYIVKMDYELTFIEFYEIIICCLHILYDVYRSASTLRP